MKFLLWLPILFVLTLCSPRTPLGATFHYGASVSVGYVHGRAGVLQPGNDAEMRMLQEGDNMTPPFVLKVEQGARLELLLTDGSAIRLVGPSMCGIDNADTEENQRHLYMKLSQGDCWLGLRMLQGAGNVVRITLPTAVLGTVGGQARIRVRPDHRAIVEVFMGEVRIEDSTDEESKAQKQENARLERLIMEKPGNLGDAPAAPLESGEHKVVDAGKMGRIGFNGTIGRLDEIHSLQRKDDPWVMWNLFRDKEQKIH